MPAGRPRNKFGKFGERQRKKYLDALRSGVGKGEAARAAGVSRDLVRLYRTHHPSFLDDEAEAIDAATDRVENALFKAALDGNVTACQVWLYNRRANAWKDQRSLKATIVRRSAAEMTDDELAAIASGGGRGIVAEAPAEPGGDPLDAGGV